MLAVACLTRDASTIPEASAPQGVTFNAWLEVATTELLSILISALLALALSVILDAGMQNCVHQVKCPCFMCLGWPAVRRHRPADVHRQGKDCGSMHWMPVQR